jgi:hypothetical protein
MRGRRYPQHHACRGRRGRSSVPSFSLSGTSFVSSRLFRQVVCISQWLGICQGIGGMFCAKPSVGRLDRDFHRRAHREEQRSQRKTKRFSALSLRLQISSTLRLNSGFLARFSAGMMQPPRCLLCKIGVGVGKAAIWIDLFTGEYTHQTCRNPLWG